MCQELERLSYQSNNRHYCINLFCIIQLLQFIDYENLYLAKSRLGIELYVVCVYISRACECIQCNTQDGLEPLDRLKIDEIRRKDP